jgi:SAM-dependent methyltransferase
LNQLAVKSKSPAPHDGPSQATIPPSDWVRRWAHLVAPGARVLDVACGNGRHMGFFKEMGCEVTGIDRNQDALSYSARYGRIIQADIENGPWPTLAEAFDAVVVTNYLWRPLWPALIQAIKPGGLIIYETFANGNETVGRPSRPEFLLQPDELLKAFEGFTIVAYENGFLPKPDRFVQRLCARKPAKTPMSPSNLQSHVLLSVECDITPITTL